MPVGPGKYDYLATMVRRDAEADTVVIVVLGGKLGNGFSVQANYPMTHELPSLLRAVADEIDANREKLS